MPSRHLGSFIKSELQLGWSISLVPAIQPWQRKNQETASHYVKAFSWDSSPKKSSWWFQPIGKILHRSNWIISPSKAFQKNVWNHHLESPCPFKSVHCKLIWDILQISWKMAIFSERSVISKLDSTNISMSKTQNCTIPLCLFGIFFKGSDTGFAMISI